MITSDDKISGILANEVTLTNHFPLGLFFIPSSFKLTSLYWLIEHALVSKQAKPLPSDFWQLDTKSVRSLYVCLDQ